MTIYQIDKAKNANFVSAKAETGLFFKLDSW